MSMGQFSFFVEGGLLVGDVGEGGFLWVDALVFQPLFGFSFNSFVVRKIVFLCSAVHF